MHKYIIEFLGTLILTFIILTTNNYLAIGGILAILVYVGGPISGGLFNPAVSIAMLYSHKLSRNDFMPYIISQITGALLAVEIMKYLHT